MISTKKFPALPKTEANVEATAEMYKIVSKTELVPKIKLFEVEAPDVAAKSHPGQFLIVIHGEKGERIPLTICGYDRIRKAQFRLLSMKSAKPPKTSAS